MKPRKRGRKPKGGKLITKNVSKTQQSEIIPNVILHLKCNIENNSFNSDIIYNPNVPTIQSNTTQTSLAYNEINTNENIKCDINDNVVISEQQTTNNTVGNQSRSIYTKLLELQQTFKTNGLVNRNSDCFWCHHSFSNPPIYIPRHRFGSGDVNKSSSDTYEVYGYFCSPECACGFLRNENLDSSIYWERYSLLNTLYGKVYDYSHNIKPAPDPFYLLNKYQGTLTIDEYRKMNTSTNHVFIIEKPLTRVMPELINESYESPSIEGSGNENKYKLYRKKPRVKTY
jgi:hypothetical protein